MEETSQQEKQESDYKNPNEDQGGIGRRLRDRDLLKKRKAEAEEKETNQAESPRKTQRAENKRGSKSRGRPKKIEPTAEISVGQEETAVPQEAPAALPEPVEVIPDEASGFLESQPAPVLATPTPLPVFGSIQNPVFAPALTSSALLNPTTAIIPPSVPASSPAIVLETAPISVPDLAPATDTDAVPVPVSDPDLAPTETPVPAAPPVAPLEVQSFYTGRQGRDGRVALNQVLIEDLGPGDDVSVSQEKRDDKDVSGTPEENKMFSVPTLSSQPPPQEYLPGNSV
ncbi:BCL-6 corepressor-like protein 1 isoform X2 [Labrus mixtus]|uniref:BCL-6 corepressor-like protein 1 isoform X2 n=1 Tax=Labrus mixtus TaxID=508554 RepID=UPI0029C0EE15|nr:BCL-6 corepressor-like protein 1 isoform X2 [Labrus mixtus]